MNNDPLTDELTRLISENKTRNSHGYWSPYAWAVRALTEQGYSVTDSARAVLIRGGEEPTNRNLASLRTIYYRIRKQVWPEDLKGLRKRGAVAPTVRESRTADVEEFEV